jgi:benzoyl-CoA reductase/2-hydroxyglutaryl-CoA dehydratase subunit BcrC/BadD/HgdB
VYALDLLEKIGAENITDEELTEAVNKAKENEALFAKTVEGLRKEYIRLQQDEEA